MRDFVYDERGQEVRVGDMVVKAQRQSSSTWLNVYKVLALLDPSPTAYDQTIRIRGEILFTTGYNTNTISVIQSKNILKVELP